MSWIDGVSPEVLAYIHGMPKPRPENLHCAKYYFEEGHRRVTPYYYVYEEYFKSEPPEASRTVWGHLSRGIPLITKEFVQHRINEGQIFVNLEPIRSGKNAAFSLLFSVLRYEISPKWMDGTMVISSQGQKGFL